MNPFNGSTKPIQHFTTIKISCCFSFLCRDACVGFKALKQVQVVQTSPPGFPTIHFLDTLYSKCSNTDNKPLPQVLHKSIDLISMNQPNINESPHNSSPPPTQSRGGGSSPNSRYHKLWEQALLRPRYNKGAAYPVTQAIIDLIRLPSTTSNRNHLITFESATEQIVQHNDERRVPTSKLELEAIDRLSELFTRSSRARLGPDLIYKVFRDFDIVFFKAQLLGNVEVWWVSSVTDDSVYGSTAPVRIGKARIAMDANAIFSEKVKDVYLQMFRTLLHEMVVSGFHLSPTAFICFIYFVWTNFVADTSMRISPRVLGGGWIQLAGKIATMTTDSRMDAATDLTFEQSYTVYIGVPSGSVGFLLFLHA